MGFWRKIVDAVSHEDGTGSMYATLIGAPLTLDPPPATKPAHEKPMKSKSAQTTRK